MKHWKETPVSREDLLKWCAVPMAELTRHPDSKAQLVLHDDKNELQRRLCDMLADELIANNVAGKPTHWILPCHVGMFDHLVQRINSEKISMQHAHIFHMDDFLDWQGRPYPEKAVFSSCKGTMQAELYDRILPQYNVPVEQRHFPDVYHPDAMDEAIEAAGGVDTLVGGVGCKGMVAFCEAPRSPYHRITLQEYARSKTRIVSVLDDTIVAYAEREFGGCYDAIPPMAITIGMKSMLQAQKALFMVATGAWKQTVIRVAMFGSPTMEYPVTLFTNSMPCTIFTNAASADHVLSHMPAPDTLV